MSDDEVDTELLELLRKSLAVDGTSPSRSAKTGVLEDAEFVYDNATDVALDMRGTKAAASSIWTLIQQKQYSTRDWSKHELHPKTKDESTVDFVFLMDLLNFCFWSEGASSEQYTVEYRGKAWTGYWSLVAAIHRALDEGIPITSPAFWIDERECTDDLLEHVFRPSAHSLPMPLLSDRMYCLREAGYVLRDHFQGTFTTCIERSKGSSAALVNLLVDNFPCLDDRHEYQGTVVRFHKRAQILIADLWACFEGQSYGYFHDIDQITMFADYRIPQMLHSLGCLQYSPPLESHVRQKKTIDSGHPWEIQLRGCSIWCVELLRREIERQHPETRLNAILIDFFLYDTMKEMEGNGQEYAWRRNDHLSNQNSSKKVPPKQQVKAPNLKIREKWTATQNRSTQDLSTASHTTVAPKPRRRLVQGRKQQSSPVTAPKQPSPIPSSRTATPNLGDYEPGLGTDHDSALCDPDQAGFLI